MKTFLLFRQKCLEALWCAVPEDFIVPRFLTPQHWEFGGVLETANLPYGFQLENAYALSKMNGFYLFHSTK